MKLKNVQASLQKIISWIKNLGLGETRMEGFLYYCKVGNKDVKKLL
jgi:hypothetical protein